MSRIVAVLFLLATALPLRAQERVELIVDVEGVRRTGGVTTQFEPNAVRYEPRFDDGGGIGGGVAWFFTGRVALELKVAGLASEITVRRSGRDFVTIGELGYAQIYPITAVAQWHPVEQGSLRPYVGIGVAHIILRNVERSGGGVTGVAFDDPTGLVVNAGLRIPFSSRWSLNGDARYVPVETDGRATFGGTGASASIDVRPLLVGVGITYRF